MFQTKKGVMCIVIVAILLTCGFTDVEPYTENEMPQILFQYTADQSDDTPWANQSGNCQIVEMDQEHKNVMSIETVSTLYGFINRDTPIDSGQVVLSWDFKTSSSKGMTFVRLYSGFHKEMNAEIEDEMFEAMMWYVDGRVGPFTGFDGWKLDGQTQNYTPDIWNHIDLWIDIENKTAEIYIDGELLANINITDSFDKFCAFSITASDDGEAVTNYIDNVYVGYVPQTGYDTGFDFCRVIPEEVESSVNVDIIVNQIGNIFFEKSGELCVKLSNPYDRNRNLKLTCTAIADTGRKQYEEVKNMTLASKGTETTVFEFNVNEYGFYHAYLEVQDEETGEIITKGTRFSVLNAPPEGVMNHKQGINTHFNNDRGTDRINELMNLYASAGFWSIREGIDYNLAYGFDDANPRAYKLEDYVVNRLAAAKENGQQSFPILGWATLLSNNNRLPTSVDEVSRWRDYVKEIVLTGNTYGITDYELLNEINIRISRNMTTTEDYVRLMKETYEVVHQYSPNGRLLVFGTANTNAVEFIEECFQLGCADYMDGVTIHPYNALYRPDEDKFLKDVQDIKSLMEKYGVGDMPLIFSELGWTSGENYVTEEQQAMYTVRASALVFDDVEYINWYNDIEKVDLDTEGEIHFGMLRGFRGQDINYEAKPVFAAMSNYNAFMAEAKSNGKVRIFDNGGYVCRFKDKDDSDIYMIWKTRDEEELRLDVGAEYATVYDFYGNATKIKTENGILNLSVSEYPQYVVGNFTTCEEIKDVNIFTSDTNITAILNDSIDLTVTNGGRNDQDYRVELDLPDNMSLVSDTGFQDGKSKLHIKTGGQNGTDEKIRVYVKDDEDNVVWYKQIDVLYTQAVTAEFSVQHYKNSKWQGVLKLTNNKNDTEISGVLSVKSPETLAKYVKNMEFDAIGPRSTRLLEFNIPESLTKDFIEFEGEIDFEDGQKINIKESSYFVSLMPVERTPKIDGVIETGEYNVNAPIRLDKERMVTPVPGTTWEWQGVDDLSGEGYINYDKDYFYIAFSVKDNILGDNDEQERIWANDSIQFAFAAERRQGSGITEIGMGIVNGEPKLERYSFLGEKQNILWLEAVGKKEGFNEDTELAIVRQNDTTTYELKLSWEDIYGIKTPFAMKNVYFSTIINENDTKGRLGWLEFSPGIGSEKNEMAFTKVPVVR